MAATLSSMTGFATHSGRSVHRSWQWEIRSVNSRGLDARFALPEICCGLEPDLRQILSGKLRRGRCSISLRIESSDSRQIRLNREALREAMKAIRDINTSAAEAGIMLTQDSASAILAIPGIMTTDTKASQDLAAWHVTLKQEFSSLVDTLVVSRRSEGQVLSAFLRDQIGKLETLRHLAGELAVKGQDHTRETLRTNVNRLLAANDGLDENSLLSHLAGLAAKSDVTEELDRLQAHLMAAGNLLASGGPIGRKLDFLAQELNREANTLCAKSSTTELNAVGLEIKVVIDRFREQVQNVE